MLKTEDGAFLKKAILHAVESSGGQISASFAKNNTPINVGSHDEIVTVLPIHVLWTKDYYFKKRSGVTLIHLSADGTVQRD